MNIPGGSGLSPVAMLIALLAVATQGVAWAQTQQQMDYERQQREYWRQQEQQRQEQQRQQQQMNENARRQQEESRRLNAPAGQSPTPGYQGATPQVAPRQSGAPAGAPANTAATDWASSCSSQAYGGTEVYVARSTIRRSGDLAKMWDMYDFKTVQTIAGKRVLSVRNQHEYDCKSARRRMLSTTGFAGHMGKGAVVAFDNTPMAWERVTSGDFVEACYWKVACGKK